MGDDEKFSLELPHGPGTKVSWIVRVTSRDSAEPALLLAHSMAEVEHIVEEALAEHVDDVVRIVHTLTGRQLHLVSGAVIQIEWEAQISDWRCMDCGVDTDAINEYYMLEDPVWEQVADGTAGHLCIGCLEQRLGRALNAADFTDREINTSVRLRRSPRLAARIQANS